MIGDRLDDDMPQPDAALPSVAAAPSPEAVHGNLASGNVFDLDRVRILRALAERQRYKYVQPRVERAGPGWKIVSANCSRNVDASGAEIDIAWFVPLNEGGWLLHARDHVQGCWVLKAAGLALHEALERVCADPDREYWQ